MRVCLVVTGERGDGGLECWNIGPLGTPGRVFSMHKLKKMKDIITFEEHLDQRYGRVGTRRRTEFEVKAKAFAIGEILRDARKAAHITQEELAKKTGTQKSFISRIENGRSDIQLSTLYRLIEVGLGKRVTLTIT